VFAIINFTFVVTVLELEEVEIIMDQVEVELPLKMHKLQRVN
jgi:hypothetical protein